MEKFHKFLHSNGYYFVIVLAGLLSLIILVLSYIPHFNISRSPYIEIDIGTLLIFCFDYFGRLYLAKNKSDFFRHNILDLLAILPFNTIFNVFRVFRVVNVLRFAKVFTLIRFIGTAGKMQKNAKKFLRINGFIYLIIICGIVLVTAAISYSLAENVSLSNSFWWAIVTASTVGYGDVAPTTLVGRISAVSLMIIGIGFIGTLTSTITNYFTQETSEKSDDKLDQILVKLDKIEQENRNLHHEIEELKRSKDKTNDK
ncbi:potassium channel family protein [Companilactobacillus sp. HBUAS56275]|uniref:Potassium channel family protein n=1 Tax=Candidatus Companilactobacillus pullicola TaxID=2838523 RepID=A0A9D1ZM13_9LACO|nr:potassium channel family protein [Candidatus Companilactobacillus pullicola]